MWDPYNVVKQLEINSFYTVFLQEHKKGYFFSGEKHDFWEMVYVIKGNVRYITSDKSFDLPQNGIVFLKPMEFHQFRISQNSDAELFIASFSASGLLMENFKDIYTVLNVEHISMMLNMIEYVKKHDNLLENSMYVQSFSNMVELFFISLIENGYISSEPKSNESIIFYEAVNVLKEHLNDWVNVPEVASECGVSVSKLKTIFSKYTDIGVYKYFLKMKIVKASALLREGKNVSEIADVLGFENQSYFSSVFKRETGISPTEYKKSVNKL